MSKIFYDSKIGIYVLSAISPQGENSGEQVEPRNRTSEHNSNLRTRSAQQIGGHSITDAMKPAGIAPHWPKEDSYGKENESKATVHKPKRHHDWSYASNASECPYPNFVCTQCGLWYYKCKKSIAIGTFKGEEWCEK